VAAFSAVRRICRTGATLHTYSRATATRSALLLGGFSVGFGVSSFGDRQTTIAALDVGDLTHPLDRRWLDRLTRSSAPFPPDAPDDALARIAALMQFGAATAAAAPGLPTVPNARCPASQPTESPQVP
jgi:queuine tRNA-ribosyltransferase